MQVFAFGKAAEGQLGIGRSAKGDVAAPTGLVAVTRNLVDRGRRVVAVSAGEAHSLVLAHDGALLYFGAMAGGPPTAHHPTEVGVAEGERVVGLSSGRDHALVLTDRGRVYSFGGGAKGQLGHGDLRGRERPERITAFDDKRIDQIAAGAEHRYSDVRVRVRVRLCVCGGACACACGSHCMVVCNLRQSGAHGEWCGVGVR